jgi:hypothetical protein
MNLSEVFPAPLISVAILLHHISFLPGVSLTKVNFTLDSRRCVALRFHRRYLPHRSISAETVIHGNLLQLGLAPLQSSPPVFRYVTFTLFVFE